MAAEVQVEEVTVVGEVVVVVLVFTVAAARVLVAPGSHAGRLHVTRYLWDVLGGGGGSE